MNIELKNIKVSKNRSEETICFTADLYINKKLVSFCKNRGNGEMTDYRAIDRKDDILIQQAEIFAKTLDPINTEWGPLPMDLELLIDMTVEKYANSKYTPALIVEKEGTEPRTIMRNTQEDFDINRKVEIYKSLGYKVSVVI